MISLPAAIKAEIERAYGQPIRYPADCERLALRIRETLNETIGVTTLKRLFGFVNDVKDPRMSTLDILARFCGFENYDQMKCKVAEEGDSDFEKKADILSSSLCEGAVVCFEYLPDRKVKLLYLGNSRFKVVESINGSLRKNDIITVTEFNLHFPLAVSNVKRNGENLGKYTAGKISGITSLYLEDSEENR